MKAALMMVNGDKQQNGNKIITMLTFEKKRDTITVLITINWSQSKSVQQLITTVVSDSLKETQKIGKKGWHFYQTINWFLIKGFTAMDKCYIQSVNKC